MSSDHYCVILWKSLLCLYVYGCVASWFCKVAFECHLYSITVEVCGILKNPLHSDQLLVFAGTTERVCLIQGTVEALNAVHGFIAEKIREMPQNVAKTEPVSILQPQTTVNPDRIKQVSFWLGIESHSSSLEVLKL